MKEGHSKLEKEINYIMVNRFRKAEGLTFNAFKTTIIVSDAGQSAVGGINKLKL